MKRPLLNQRVRECLGRSISRAKSLEACDGAAVNATRAWLRIGCWLMALGLGNACFTWAQPAGDETPQPSDESSEQPISFEPTTPAGKGSGETDYASFRLIVDRNIFNGNRSGQRITSTRNSSRLRSVQVDSFALVGTLISSKGPLAFFDGSESAFRQVLRPGDTIAGYRVDEVMPAGVRLADGTNVMDLCVGNGMRREDGGGWRLALGADSYASSAGGASFTSDPEDDGRSRGSDSFSVGRGERSGDSDEGEDNGAPAETDDVLKRLMEQREKEMQ
jgi:hypothetical protein